MTRAFPLLSLLVFTGFVTAASPVSAGAAGVIGDDPAVARTQTAVGRLVAVTEAQALRARSNMGPTGHEIAAEPPPMGRVPALAAGVRRVSQIAGQYGDRLFLVVDKIHGKIALFENGEPIYIAEALTGANRDDFLPADAKTKTYAQQTGLKYKVTPAGRYTVSPSHDPKYGNLFEINELQAKDWVIAIHRVALGNSQQRDVRLRSPNIEDKHITEGCIDVDQGTIQELFRRIGKKTRVPIYILPMDDSLIARFFPSRETASNQPARLARAQVADDS